MRSDTLVICQYCDAVHERRPLPTGAVARCCRCDGELYCDKPLNLDALLALTLTAALAFVLANSYPIVEMELQRSRNTISLWGAVVAAYDSGIGLVAVLAAATLFFFPMLQIMALLWVLVPLRVGRRPPAFAMVMHALRHMRPWGMIEVFMLGVLVSVVKLVGLAQIAPDVGLWAFAALTLLMTALVSVDAQALWARAEACPP
ncbi:MAG TPA: paraquat-inducible protein A [Solimonas sp.]